MKKFLCFFIVLTVFFSGCIGGQTGDSGERAQDAGVEAPSVAGPTTTLEETTSQNKHLISPQVTTTIASTLTTSIQATSSVSAINPQK